MSEPTHDPATDPASPPTAPADSVVSSDPARPAATATAHPTPADSASDPDTAHPAEATPPAPNVGGYGLGGYLDPGASAPRPVDDEGGYVSAKPLLMIGAAGPDVAELGHLLAEHGFENDVSRGTADAPPVLDDALMAIVIAFQQDNGLDPWARESDDATAPPLLRRDHSGVVDARTWEALLGEPARVIREGARA